MGVSRAGGAAGDHGEEPQASTRKEIPTTGGVGGGHPPESVERRLDGGITINVYDRTHKACRGIVTFNLSPRNLTQVTDAMKPGQCMI